MTSHPIPIAEYDYQLDDAKIAKFPLESREKSKLLIYNHGEISQTRFDNIVSHLPQDSLLVFNNTKVIRARLVMHKPTGARIELFCLEPFEPADHERAFAAKGCSLWRCMVGNSKKWKDGPLSITFSLESNEYTLNAERAEKYGQDQLIRFHWDAPLTFGQLLEHLGKIPIPPYLGRESDEIDNSRYQTVYSRFEGSVAAPTAGLHFSNEIIENLQDKNIRTAEVTLHVGAGTFLPVKDDDASKHTMHTEHFIITPELLRSLIEKNGNVTAVGTTTVRTLESLPALGYRVLKADQPANCEPVGQWEPYDVPNHYDGITLIKALLDYMEKQGMKKLDASTRIMIRPGFRFRVTTRMITNFHQPKSTLLLLVSAFIGSKWKDVYEYALANDFRFLSYGDSSLLIP